MKILFVIILNLFVVNAFCCDCKTFSKSTEYNSSDLVFLGEVVYVVDTLFKIKVIDIFKGNEYDTLYALLDNCSVFPNENETWLFYAKNLYDNKVHISQCGWSRSFNWPFSPNQGNLPKPPSQSTSREFLNIANESSMGVARLELYNDILGLRQMKLQDTLDTLKSSCIKQQEYLKEKLVYLTYISILLVIFIGIVGIKIFITAK